MVGSWAHHVIAPHHCDGELDNEDEVWWTKPQAIWLTLGLKVDWHGLFQIWPGAKGWWLLPLVSPLSSQVTVPLIGHSPLLHNYHFSHLGENPFFLGWRLKRRNLNLEVFLWLLLHQERMPQRMSDLFLNGHTFEQIVLIPTLSKKGGELSVNINEATYSTAKDLGEIKV